MLRFLAQFVLSLLANAVGLIVASMVLDDFAINGFSFAVAVTIFTLSTAILGPFITKVALTNAPFLMGGIALVTTFIGLLLTTVISDGLSITGLSTWLLSTFIVWVFSVIANILLPLVLFKKVLKEAKNN